MAAAFSDVLAPPASIHIQMLPLFDSEHLESLFEEIRNFPSSI